MNSQTNRNGTTLIKPKQQRKQPNNQKPISQPKPTTMPNRGGTRIGDNEDPNKWRCNTCKFLNAN
jgi:hypothetical protein